MLSRRREQWIVFLGLVAVNAALGWYLFRQWRYDKSRTQWIYGKVAATEGSVPASPPARKLVDQNFSDIVPRNLFRPDRSNESAPAAAAKMPELPLLYGTMNLGNGSFALMAPGDQSSALSKRVFPGDEVGGYKVVSIAASQVVVEWGEKKVNIDVTESARRVPRVIEKTQATPTTQPAAPTSTATSSSRVTTAGLASGNARGGPNRAGYNAPPGAPEDAPAGTVINGKKKVVEGMFGIEKVYWIDVPATGGSPQKPNPN